MVSMDEKPLFFITCFPAIACFQETKMPPTTCDCMESMETISPLNDALLSGNRFDDLPCLLARKRPGNHRLLRDRGAKQRCADDLAVDDNRQWLVLVLLEHLGHLFRPV